MSDSKGKETATIGSSSATSSSKNSKGQVKYSSPEPKTEENLVVRDWPRLQPDESRSDIAQPIRLSPRPASAETSKSPPEPKLEITPQYKLSKSHSPQKGSAKYADCVDVHGKRVVVQWKDYKGPPPE